MKTIYENTVNHLELNIHDENPSSCISNIECDDNTLVSIANDTDLHKFIITTNALPVGTNSKLVKFTYTITDSDGNINHSYEYFLIIKKTIVNTTSSSNLSFSSITGEDLIYYTIINNSKFNKMYYDIFYHDFTFDTVSDVTYDHDNTCYVGSPSAYAIETILDNDNTITYYDFMVHLQSDDNNLLTVEYSINNGTTWIAILNDDLDKVIHVSSGFTTLMIRITWTNNNTLYSFGVFYDYIDNTNILPDMITLNDESSGDINREDLIYYSMLNSILFKKCYYDTFRDNASLDSTSLLIYEKDTTSYSGPTNAFLIQQILDGSLGITYYDIVVHLESDDNNMFNIEYSIDNGTTWITIPNNKLDDIITISSGFTILSLKITWTGNNRLYSFGVFYDKINNPPVIDSTSWDNNDHYDTNSYTLTIAAHDPDINTILSYNLTCSDPTVNITQNSTNPNVFTVTYPDYSSDTTVTYTVTVTDNDGAVTSTTLSQLVKNS